jgi:hypothetical protein
MVQLFTTRCSCIAILWVSLVSFAAITLCVASQRVFIASVVVVFVIDSVRKLLYTPSYYPSLLIEGLRKWGTSLPGESITRPRYKPRTSRLQVQNSFWTVETEARVSEWHKLHTELQTERFTPNTNKYTGTMFRCYQGQKVWLFCTRGWSYICWMFIV